MKFSKLVDGINRFMQTELCVRLGEALVFAGAVAIGYCIKGIKDKKESQKNFETLKLVTEALYLGAASTPSEPKPDDNAECEPLKEETNPEEKTSE